MTANPHGRKLRIPEIFHSKWDEMLLRYNSIIDRVNKISFNHYQRTARFRTRYGIVVNLNDFGSRMSSVLYKLQWAMRSLEYLTEFHEKRAKFREELFRGIPEAFVFNADVFFCFAYTALDVIAGVIDKVVETGIKARDISFVNVIDFLAGPNSPYIGSVFLELKSESKAGWIYEFRQYRVFFTHYGRIPLWGELRSAGEVKHFMLPDDPQNNPFDHKKEREIAPYCQEVLLKELDLMTALLDFVDKVI